MISDPTGKKVYLETGDFVGIVDRIFVDELGYTIAVIKTELTEMPEVRVNIIALKKIKKDDEDCYVIKSPPLKLVEIIKEKKREEEIRRLEHEIMQKKEKEETREEAVAEEVKATHEPWFRRLINKIKEIIRKILKR